MYRRGLKSAVSKLEARTKPRQFRWPIIIAQYPEEGCGEIIGLKAGDNEFPRLYRDKDFPAFALRVQQDGGGPMEINAPKLLVALYGEPVAVAAPVATPAPPVAPVEAPQAQHVRGYFREGWLGGR